MPLDPRISLLYQPPQIPMPDVGRTMLQAAQLQEAQLRRQAHEVAMQDLLREREREKALQAYVTRQMGRGQAAPLSQLMPDTAMGTPLSQVGPQASGAATDPAWPYESFTRDDMEAARTPGGVRQVETQRPAPGVQAQTVTEVAPGRRQQATTVASAQGPQRLTEHLDWREMYAASPKQGMALYKTIRDMERTEATDEMKLLTGTVNALDDLARMVHDQPSLDQARAALGRIPGMGAEIAGTLPAVYDDAAWEKVLQRLVPVKQRLQQSATSLNLTWGQDAQGNFVPMQTTQAGELRRSQVPPGITPLPPTRPLDVGTGYAFAGPGGTTLGGAVPKDIQGKALQEAQGGVQGKTAGEQPQKARDAQATLSALEQKHQLVGQEIDRALQIVETSTLPTTGVVGDFLKTFYQPGRDIANLVETIGANIGLDELQSLKATGSTLGQVTEAEHRLLQSVLGNLKQSSSQEQFTRNLTRLKTTLADVKQRRQQAAQQQFGGAVAPSSPSPYGHMRPQDMSPEQRREELQWLKQRYQGGQ